MFLKERNFTVSSLSFAVTELPFHWGKKQTNKRTETTIHDNKSLLKGRGAEKNIWSGTRGEVLLQGKSPEC